MVLEAKDGTFRMVSFQNRRYDPAIEYVDAQTVSAPFSLSSRILPERFFVKEVWSKPMVGAVSVDVSGDDVRVIVKKGDMIGYSVGPRASYSGDQVRWISIIEYEGGGSYSSADDAKVEQGPLWKIV